MNNGGGSSLCNIDAIFTVFHVSFSSAIALLFRCTCLPQEQPLAPRRDCLLINEPTVLLNFFLCRFACHSQYPQGSCTSAEWCFLGSIVQWYTGSGVPLPFPKPIKLLCCRCYLNFRRTSDLHVPCYWCEMLQGMGYPPRS